MKKVFIIFGVVFCLFLAAAILFYFHLARYAETPAPGAPVELMLVISPGQDLRSISESLQRGGIIVSRLKFEWLCRLRGYEKQLKAGEYLFSSAMTPTKILDILTRGQVYLHRLTVPEGYNLLQIAAAVARAGLAAETDFIAAAAHPALLRQSGVTGEKFEGYLFPDTYYFPKGVSAQKMISTMVRRFWSVWTPELKKRAEQIGFSIHQAVTLASIIEKETAVPAERPLVSSVFHNRLKKGIRLESDPTVIYGIENFDGNITRKHLLQPTNYNTYRIKGLPPGPIASPGKDAITAALFPADTSFYYFVAKKDKTHKFSTTHAEHKLAVGKYQLSR
ncbi:MAG: endolytic transglycosylase MltG [Desulfobacterales bacterium]|nr:endolytic transglycosylase MltG [Desulfobacterales bacterium]